MKKIFYIFLLFLGFIDTSATAQNLLYKKIEQDKNNGEKFERAGGIFIKAENNKEILREFKNSEEVSFLNYNPELFDKLGQTVSIELPLKNSSIIVELEAVDNEFYSYTVTTEKGDAFPANRAIKHYRGIIKDNKNSLVALSFSAETANGIIANETGNFNVSSINDTEATVFFKDDNTVYENFFECGDTDKNIDYENLKNVLPPATSFEPIDLSNFKCLRIYFELRYDMFERFAFIDTTDVETDIISKTTGYFSSVFNQVATLFFNEGITAVISELKINTGPDSYPVYTGTLQSNGCASLNDNETGDVFTQFGANLTTNYNGDIAQLVSAKRGTSTAKAALRQGANYQNNTLCTVPKNQLFSSVNIGIESCNTNKNFFENYSWNINVIIHELGHNLGSSHTHSAVWYPEYTSQGYYVYYPIDNCAPYSTVSGYTAILTPKTNDQQSGGTIMSYCHLSGNNGILFTKGFSEQPRNRIRSKICNNRYCISLYCFKNLYIGYPDDKSATNDYNVPLDKTDNRKASNNIYAYHTIASGGQATYTAGNSIRLLPSTVMKYGFLPGGVIVPMGYNAGFHAQTGSTVHLKIEDCIPMEYTISSTSETETFENEDKTLLPEKLFVNLYPNPTPDIITVESNEEIIGWELTNETGKILQTKKINPLKKFEVNFAYLSTGVYFIKIYLSNGQIAYKKMIKQ